MQKEENAVPTQAIGENPSQKTVKKTVSPSKSFSESHLFFAAAFGTLVIFGFLAAMFFLPKAPSPTANVVVQTETQDTVVAVVGGENIYMSELDKRYETVPKDLRADLSKRSVLENMIENKIVLQEAQKSGITATDEEISSVITEREGEFAQLVADGTVSEEFLEGAVRDFVTVNKFLEEIVFSSLQVSEETSLDFFNSNKESLEQVRASHILVATKEEAEEIISLLGEGKAFAELSSEKSLDTAAAQNGGDLGFFSRTDVVKEFSDAAFSMQPNDPARIVETSFGFHVVIVTGRMDSFEDFKAQIESYLLQLEKDKAYKEFIEQKKQEKEIQVRFSS